MPQVIKSLCCPENRFIKKFITLLGDTSICYEVPVILKNPYDILNINIRSSLPLANLILMDSIIHHFGKKIGKLLMNCVNKEHYSQESLGRSDGFYEGVEETLKILKGSNWKLAICTNSPTDYFELIRELYNLDKYFDVMYWVGKYPGRSKAWMVGRILKEVGSSGGFMIGDHYHDIEAAKENNLISIGCLYGFDPDEAKHADFTITDIIELPTLLQKIKKRI